jgi:hypothetical protein
MRLSIAAVARHQWEDAMLDTINDDARVKSFDWITIASNGDGTYNLIARFAGGRALYEPGTAAQRSH